MKDRFDCSFFNLGVMTSAELVSFEDELKQIKRNLLETEGCWGGNRTVNRVNAWIRDVRHELHERYPW